jgi:uncharacterized damage-inducible protein DinB
MSYAGRYLILDRVQKGDSLRALLTKWLQRTRWDKFKGVGMNSELRRLEEQLRKALEGGAWHGPSVLEVLEGVTAEQAVARPIAGAHSIWELVLHMCSDYSLVLRRLNGDGRPLTESEAWPAVPEQNAENWRGAIRTLKHLNAELRRAVKNFPPERLDQPLVSDPPYTAHTQFIGVTQHNLYHAGQIALIKKALKADRTQSSDPNPVGKCS